MNRRKFLGAIGTTAAAGAAVGAAGFAKFDPPRALGLPPQPRTLPPLPADTLAFDAQWGGIYRMEADGWQQVAGPKEIAPLNQWRKSAQAGQDVPDDARAQLRAWLDRRGKT